MTDAEPVINRALDALHGVIDECRVCAPMVGEGYEKIVGLRRGGAAPVVIVGQGPGRNESTHRLAFAGPAGTVLNKWLVECGAPSNEPRANVYLTSLIKCVSPSPKTYWSMVARCDGFLVQQLNLLRPKLVITLGKSAYDWFKEDDTPYGEALCRDFVVGSNPLLSRFSFPIRVMPWPHPSPANNAVVSRADMKARMRQSFVVVRGSLSSTGSEAR